MLSMSLSLVGCHVKNEKLMNTIPIRGRTLCDKAKEVLDRSRSISRSRSRERIEASRNAGSESEASPNLWKRSVDELENLGEVSVERSPDLLAVTS